MGKSVMDKNPFDIGKVFLSDGYNDKVYKKAFQDATGTNPFPPGVSLPFKPK